MALTENKSFLPNNKYSFVINRLPNFTYFVQSVNMPSITLNPVVTNSPFVAINKPSNTLVFEQLQVTYVVDEDMASWFEIYDWVKAVGNPESTDKIGNLTTELGYRNSIVSDATLFIKTNSNNDNIKVTFKDMFPIELTGFPLNSAEGQDFQTTSVTFSYNYYTAEKL